MPTLTRRASSAKRRTPLRATARLEARIPADLKALIETAAPLAGHSSVTDYLVQALRESASRTVEESRRTRLDAEQSATFVRSLLENGAPAPALRVALKRHRERVR